MLTKEYIQNNFLNKNNKLIHQKIKDINLTHEELYIIYNEIQKPFCNKCSKPLRFISFAKGYYPKCSNRECNIEKVSIYTLSKKEIEKHITRTGIDANFTKKIIEPLEEIYNFFYNSDIPKCMYCNSNLIFKSFNEGYKGCSNAECRNKKTSLNSRKTKLEKRSKTIKSNKEVKLELLINDWNCINKERLELLYKEKIFSAFLKNEKSKELIKTYVLGLKNHYGFISKTYIKNFRKILEEKELLYLFKINIDKINKEDKNFFMSLNPKTLANYNLSKEDYKKIRVIFFGREGVCEVCQKDTKYINFYKGYKKTCSSTCGRKLSSKNKGQIYSHKTFMERINESSFKVIGKYKDAHSKIKIKCLKHNFSTEAKPVNLINSNYTPNCPKCLKENYRKRKMNIGWKGERYKDKETILYFLKIKGTEIYKVGITSRSINERFRNELEKIEVLETKVYKNGLEAFLEEQKIIQNSKPYRYLGSPLLKSGNSELFYKIIK